MRGLIGLRIGASNLILGLLLVSSGVAPAEAQTGANAEITAILDQEKPDPSRAAKVRRDADANPPANAGNVALGQFHFTRCQARSTLGRFKEAISDCEKAISYGGDYVRDVSRWQQFLSNQYRSIGEYRKSIALENQIRQKFEEIDKGKGRSFGINLRIALAYLAMGELKQAEVYAKKNQALLAESKGWNNRDAAQAWEASVANGDARLFEAQGRFRDAELAYHRSSELTRIALAKSPSWKSPPPMGSMEATIDTMTASEGRMKAKQGRLAEGEVDIRRALLSRLRNAGKYNLSSAQMAGTLAGLLSEQSRYAEAEQLARTEVEIERTLGYADSAPVMAFALNRLASTLFSQNRWDQAGEIYATLDDAIKDWEPLQRDRIQLGWSRIFTNYYTRKVAAGIELAQTNVEHTKARVGDKHFDYAMAQAILATGYVFARRDAEAMQLFNAALPVLLQASRNSEEDTAGAVAYYSRLSNVIEAYLTLLARAPDPGGTHAAESFQLRDLIGGRSVQRALEASSARAAAGNPALAALVRKDQDLEKQIAAAVDNLNTMLALPPEERDATAMRDLNAGIGKARAERTTAQREIARKFPSYADLVTPRPPLAADIRAALKAEEAFLAFYFGRRGTYVWAVPKQGPIAFHAAGPSSRQFDEKIRKLREALEPQAATIGDIPPFDLKTASELYELLLKPIEAAWKPAKSLIVVTNGSLGLLPLGLLPTAPAELKPDGETPFASYRDVPWLARSHAVTSVPSAAALLTLRRLPAGSAKRQQMIGFGDPLFSSKQAAELAQAESTAPSDDMGLRGIPLKLRAAPRTRGVSGAELAMLPRLPDTADELKSIAAALQADPSKVLNLGKAANEDTVRNSDLSKFRIIVFATHGLVPGELEGLRQPALALSAPDVAGVGGDGLLTMEEILTLKLDADWVVLSACNTGAGAGAGAEAASGLGRAFFYAGTRAILVTNWSVHSASARALIADLFTRQAADSKLTRGEALRQAMMGLLDGPGYTDGGKTLFSFGHPLFWAPYTIIGDGG
jgi:CHAT domain-containing protein